MDPMTPSTRAYDLVMTYEGFRDAPYLDAAGYITIGYGHRTMVAPKKITKGEALTLLRDDMAVGAAFVGSHVFVKLSQNQFDALCSLIYNIGPSQFLDSTLRKRLNTSDYHGAADQFLVWDRVKGDVVHGLLRRRMAERSMFLEGVGG